MEVQLKTLEQHIYEEAGGPFNINSPKQLGEVLFERLQLPHGKKTKTGGGIADERRLRRRVVPQQGGERLRRQVGGLGQLLIIKDPTPPMRRSWRRRRGRRSC